MKILTNGVALWLLVIVQTLCNGAAAASLAVQVTDSTGAPLENAAVYAESASGPIKQKMLKPVEIAQIKRQFVPLVTVIQVGTEVSFPNYDSVKHPVV
jgi:plastocyanin